MTKSKEPKWAWCEDCQAWIGSSYPLLPNIWDNTKSAANHKKGSGHDVKLYTSSQIVGR